MKIPNSLLTYTEAEWMPLVESSVRYPTLRARELWRKAQDCWGTANGVWRAEFEQLRDQQLAEQQTGNQ
ncbi:hypothetical protein AB0F88_10985 [Streptosporangium sp. NPDC023963]|uniref:hypothetical protein n=1 Tax=Streptosporangium sp. NPDC023963 TaxID=3155608 RepID=UPI003448E289